MEKGNSFTILVQRLETMEETKEVDISVVEILDKLIEDCKESEKFWIKKGGIAIEKSFLLYHASRNSRLILEKMKERFVLAGKKHENPRIISDSLALVPLLSELCFILFSLRKRRITSELYGVVSQRVRLLRNAAYNVSMLPSPEEEMKGLDRTRLEKRFNRFADTLQAMFVEI